MKKITLTVAIAILTLSSYAQFSLKVADWHYKHEKYKRAIPIYKKYLTDMENQYNLEVIRKLANSYKYTNQFVLSEKMFNKLVVMDSNWSDVVNYAEVLMKNKKYTAASKFISNDQILKRKDYRIARIQYTLQSVNQLVSLDTGNIKIASLAMNSEAADFAPIYFQNGMLFSTKKKSKINRYYSSLAISPSEDNFSTVKKFTNGLQIKGNAGPASYSPKLRTMYYAVNFGSKNKSNGKKNIRIMTAYYNIDNSKWLKSNLFPYNSKEYSCTTPFITPDGTKLYFSSNMPGGLGGMDLYVCNWVNSRWTKPQNLGPNVNTASDEVYPFLESNNQFYFSSDGRGGLGGLDLFVLDMNVSNPVAENIGAPFNSYADDFGYVKNTKSDKGFFCSSRGKEFFDFDIYSFVRVREMNKKVDFYVRDEASQKLMPASVSIVFDESKDRLNQTVVDGKLMQIPVKLGDKLEVSVIAEGYDTSINTFMINRTDTAYTIFLSKQKIGYQLLGKIANHVSNENIEHVLVSLMNTQDSTDRHQTLSDDLGQYAITGLSPNAIYEVKVLKEGYFIRNDLYKTPSEIPLTKQGIKTAMNFTLISGAAYRMEKIYFDFNKVDLKEDAKKELDKVVAMMNFYTQIIVEISSYTDSRGSEDINKMISEKRSSAAVNYIISKGINSNRIIAKGYGETKLINNCTNDVNCSEAEHSRNRRTEFQVVGLKVK